MTHSAHFLLPFPAILPRRPGTLPESRTVGRPPPRPRRGHVPPLFAVVIHDLGFAPSWGWRRRGTVTAHGGHAFGSNSRRSVLLSRRSRQLRGNLTRYECRHCYWKRSLPEDIFLFLHVISRQNLSTVFCCKIGSIENARVCRYRSGYLLEISELVIHVSEVEVVSLL